MFVRWSAANQRSTPEALAEGLKSRILSLLVSLYPSWAPTRDAPTGAVLCYLYSILFRADTPVPPLQALYSVICTLLEHPRGMPLRVLMRLAAFDLVAVRIDEEHACVLIVALQLHEDVVERRAIGD